MMGKTTWVVPDGFLPLKSTGIQPSHESMCILNLTDEDSIIRLTVYFEDREPMYDFKSFCAAQRTNHIRLNELKNDLGQVIPRGVPYAVKIDASIPVIVQHSRLDSSQEALALFTTMAYSD